MSEDSGKKDWAPPSMAEHQPPPPPSYSAATVTDSAQSFDIHASKLLGHLDIKGKNGVEYYVDIKWGLKNCRFLLREGSDKHGKIVAGVRFVVGALRMCSGDTDDKSDDPSEWVVVSDETRGAEYSLRLPGRTIAFSKKPGGSGKHFWALDEPEPPVPGTQAPVFAELSPGAKHEYKLNVFAPLEPTLELWIMLITATIVFRAETIGEKAGERGANVDNTAAITGAVAATTAAGVVVSNN